MAIFPFFSKDVFRLWIYFLGILWISAYIIRYAMLNVNWNRFEIDMKILFYAFALLWAPRPWIKQAISTENSRLNTNTKTFPGKDASTSARLTAKRMMIS